MVGLEPQNRFLNYFALTLTSLRRGHPGSMESNRNPDDQGFEIPDSPPQYGLVLLATTLVRILLRTVASA
jgi:hypothetical protein